MHSLFRESSGPRTIVVCHGTGGDEKSLVWLAEALDPEAAILSPRGDVSENGMPRFFRRFAEGVFDLDDVQARAEAFGDFVLNTMSEHRRDLSKVCGVGYSNGANILAQTALLRPTVFASLVLFRPMQVLEEVGQPDLSELSVWISAGERDPIVPVQTVERLATQFIDHGATLDLNWQTGGHDLSRDEIELAKAWVANQNSLRKP